jgi:hypothetical protein
MPSTRACSAERCNPNEVQNGFALAAGSVNPGTCLAPWLAVRTITADLSVRFRREDLANHPRITTMRPTPCPECGLLICHANCHGGDNMPEPYTDYPDYDYDFDEDEDDSPY